MGSVAYGVSVGQQRRGRLRVGNPPEGRHFPASPWRDRRLWPTAQAVRAVPGHHARDPDALGGQGRTYDLTVFGLVKFFSLAMDNNPNVIDSLFTPATCVLHSTRIGNLVRENRRLFLHRGAWPKFKGYAYSQLHKLSIKQPTGKRAELVAAHGFDTKFAYHVVRLLGEVEQILVEGDIDLQRDNGPAQSHPPGRMVGRTAAAVGSRQGSGPRAGLCGQRACRRSPTRAS